MNVAVSDAGIPVRRTMVVAGRGMAERILIASGNPWAFCMATERAFIRANPQAQVDGLNLWRLSGRASPHWRPRDKLIESLNRNIDRFVAPVLSGRDITGDVRIDRGNLPPIPCTYDAVRAHEADGAKLGLAVLSSVASLTTIQNPLALSEYGPVLERAWRSAHLSLRAGQAVRALGYDKVVIFNGRHCYSRPFCDVLERQCEVIRYEQGSSGNRYISAAGSVHHPEALTRMIAQHDPDRKAGEAFFRLRATKDSSTEVGLMTATQQPGELPPTMKRGAAVAFFTSASDEMFAVTDDPLYGRFPTQHEIAQALASACRAQGLQLVVRLHPHLRFKHPAWRREWDFAALERRGALVLDPEDPADSYAILRASRCIVTTGSTIGLEAAFLGIPNAVVGTWLGGCLGAAVVANSAKDLASFVAGPCLPPGAREAALRFGSFYRTGGAELPELDAGIHANLARIDGRIVDRVRHPVQKLRYLLGKPPADAAALDVRSGLQAGRVLLPPGTIYGKAAISGVTKVRRASTENKRSGE